MTREFFNRVLSSSVVLTRQYVYRVEVSNCLKKIVRYPINHTDTTDGYVCAVYAI